MAGNPSQIFLPASSIHTECPTGAQLTTTHTLPSTPWALERHLKRPGNFSTPSPWFIFKLQSPALWFNAKRDEKCITHPLPWGTAPWEWQSSQNLRKHDTGTPPTQGYHGSAETWDCSRTQPRSQSTQAVSKCTAQLSLERTDLITDSHLPQHLKSHSNPRLGKMIITVLVARGTQWCSVQTTLKKHLLKNIRCLRRSSWLCD